MDETQVIEGTREEVVKKMRFFPKEQRFRLVALSQPGEQKQEEPSLAKRFTNRVGRLSFDPADLSERTEEYYKELLANKYPEVNKR